MDIRECPGVSCPVAPQKALLLHLTDRCCISVFDSQYSLSLFVYFDNYFRFFYFTAGLAYSDKNLELNRNTGSFGPGLGQLFWQSHKETQSINVAQKIVKRLPVRLKCFSDKSMTPGKSSFTNKYECFSERKQLDYK